MDDLVQLKIVAEGSLPIEFKWFENDSILEDDSNHRISIDGAISTLQMRTAIIGTTNVRCEVTNDSGKLETCGTIERINNTISDFVLTDSE